MTSLLVLGSAAFLVVAVIAGTVFYFWHEQRRQRAEEEAVFHSVVVQALKKRGISSVRLQDLIDEHQVSRKLAEHVAERIYASCCDGVLADAQITESERKHMTALRHALALPPETAMRIEETKKEERYRVAAMGALADGIITPQEAAELQGIRNNFGMNSRRASDLVAVPARDGYIALFRRVAADGRITSDELEELQRYRQALGLSKQEANAIIRDDALELYRRWFHDVIQDGEVTESEERALAWLRDEFGLAFDTEAYEDRLEEMKMLWRYRKGTLPVVRTRKLLEGGEICHWESRCCFEWHTATQIKEAEGELVVTSQQIIFSSPLRSFAVAPTKVIDIQTYSDALKIKTSSNRGSGVYFVNRPRELEAILIGSTRHHKYHLSNSYSSSLSRHIPDDVRREVWQRDRGRCVRCEAADYLEFDHVIPHSRGGANTVANIRILCRRCNLAKADRI